MSQLLLTQMISRFITSKASCSPLYFLFIRKIMWPPTQKTYCSTATYCEGYRMQFSGLVSPSGHRVLSQSSVTRSPRPAFTLTAELFIKGEESTGDPTNFSMGLLAVLADTQCNEKTSSEGRFEMICEYFCSIYL